MKRQFVTLSRRWRLLWGAAALLLLFVVMGSCRDRQPLHLGYLGPLSGKGAGLGIGGRDGAQLAIEEANRAGGIGGRPIVLLVEDDGQDPVQARAAVERLIDAGSLAIIGAMTSNMSVATLPLANERQILMLSPTSGSEALTARDDFFFRMHVPSGVLGEQLATLLVERREVRRVAVLADQGNLAFTTSFLDGFSRTLAAHGGEVVTVVPFVSAQNPRYSSLTRVALSARPEALLLLANAADAALLAQQIHKTGQRPLLLGCEWLATPELVTMGGGAVEGLLVVLGVDSDSRASRYQRFAHDFAVRFGYRPTSPAVYAYEAATVLLRALRKNPESGALRATIAGIADFDGLQGPIHINHFGDPSRAAWPMVVRDGRFMAVEAP